ncbi:MAG: hypothetical protein GW855_03195 [Erythrobacter sp.]|nr:hypothetical protein [Erythrobacter sp.]NCQ63625.1 hypothetical protein [Alphaproteobacteria bacterium]
MTRLIALGLAIFIAANLLITLAYGFLWPYLYDWDIISWDSDARFWFELVFHGAIAAIIGLPFCFWFVRRISRSATAGGDH